MYLGIDVGTARARAARLDADGCPQVVLLADGTEALPVYARQTLTGLEVGSSAMRAQAGNSETTVAACTRLMGRPEHVPAQLRAKLPFGIREEAGEIICDLLYAESPVSRLYGRLVRRLVDEAEAATGQAVEGVVLTVPASAEDRFRIQARSAVEREGIPVLRLLNRPAAALRAAHFGAGVAYVGIVNCDGSTIEVSVAARQADTWQIIATAGDLSVGVDDFMWSVAEGMSARIEQTSGIDVAQVGYSSASLWGLRHAAEEAMATLQYAYQTTVAIDHGGGFGRDLVTVVQRHDVDDWLDAHMTHVRAVCTQALAAAQTSAEQIAEVLLIGDWAKLPMLGELVAEQFARPVGQLRTESSARLAVLGAAIATAEASPLVWDVTPYALGINCFYGERELFSPIVPANSAIPTPTAGSKRALTESYQTRKPNQKSVTLCILQYRGDRSPDPYGTRPVTPDECEVLGTWEFAGLHPRKGRHAAFTVNFAVSEDGILHLKAHETQTGRELSATVDRAIG